jgi:hypothetical protein
MMRLSVAVLTAALVTGSLVACSNGNGFSQTPSVPANDSAQTRFINGGLIPYGAPRTSVLPFELRSSGILAKIHAAGGLGRDDAVTPGIYAATYDVINAYPVNDRSNGPPVCSIDGVGRPSALAVDPEGDVIVSQPSRPNSGPPTIYVFAGPGLCGPELGSMTDPFDGDRFGHPADVAGRNVANGGKIVVANVKGSVGGGSVSICTLSGGCTVNLRAGHINFFAVALANNGDCWGSGIQLASSSPTLVYFAHCRGRGVMATGFKDLTIPEALDIDDSGNLVSISDNPSGTVSKLYIYSGCNPACSLVGGPFRLKSCLCCCSVKGHLDASSKQLVTEDSNKLDVYSYSTSGIKYEYSIHSLGTSDGAFSPSSRE